jgi:hypothetical protein
MALTKIKTGGITDSAITTAKINNDAVTDAKVANAITVTGAQTGITQVGTLTAGTWQGTKIASAYLDDDTAHLSGSTFTGTVSLGDLDIIPTSSNISVIKHDSGSGSLTLQGDQVNIKNRAGDETGLSYNDGGGVTFGGSITQSANANLRHTITAGGSGEASLVLTANNSTGDSFVRWETNANTFCMGLDNSDSNKFILSCGSDPHSNSVINIQPDGSSVAVDKPTTFNGTVTIPSGSYVYDDHANFGIGAIVSNWGTAYDVLNVGHSSAYWCEVGDYADRGMGWGNNVYHNGSNYKSIYEDQVSAITQKAGNIKFYTTGVKGTTTNMTTPGDGDPRVTIQNDGATLFGTASRTATGVGGASFDPNSVGRCLLLLGSVNYTSSVDVARFYNDNGEVGDIRTDGSGASFNSNSDYRLKENEVPLSNALTRLNNLKPYRFNFKADENKTLDGFFAHEVQEVVPEAVTGTKDQMKAIQYQPEDEIPEGKEVYDIKEYSTTEIDPQKMDASKLVPLLVAAVQELSAKVTALENA